MSISSIAATLIGQSNSGSSSGGAKPRATAASANAQNDAASSVSTVTLSADAQAMASLNSMGVTVAQVPLTYALNSGFPGGAVPTPLPGGTDGSLSKSDFEAVLEKYGSTQAQANQIFAATDTDGNGAISNDELLSAMASTASGGSTASQTLLQLMDANHNGSVSSQEYVKMESDLLEAETPSA